jgi:hypothetical protein
VENPNTAVILAVFTTAAARLKLLRGMEQLAEREDATLLYTDTDSYFYIYKEALGDPLESGTHLGDLVDESPDAIITEFVCGTYSLFYGS